MTDNSRKEPDEVLEQELTEQDSEAPAETEGGTAADGETAGGAQAGDAGQAAGDGADAEDAADMEPADASGAEDAADSTAADHSDTEGAADGEAADESGAEDAAGDGAADDETGFGNKKGFFRKKEKKDPKDEKIADLTDRLQRQMAEFDNFRKRTEKEKASMYQIGAKDVIEKLLPVVDNFERGLETGDESDPFVEGMNKIYKQLTTMLTDLGVTPIEAVGQPFDPELHNAVMHVDDDTLGENTVAEEFQKGYLYKDSVVRHSMVKVAN